MSQPAGVLLSKTIDREFSAGEQCLSDNILSREELKQKQQLSNLPHMALLMCLIWRRKCISPSITIYSLVSLLGKISVRA